MADTEAFDEFYRGSARRLLRYAFGLTGDLGSAQDLVQEAYARAWQRWRQVSGYAAPEAWLRLVVARLATDRWRRLRSARAADARTPRQVPVDPPSEDVVLLVRALRTLAPAQRRALAMHYLLDLPVSEIATELDVPTGTVKSWLARGRAALAGLLAEARTSDPVPTGGSDA